MVKSLKAFWAIYLITLPSIVNGQIDLNSVFAEGFSSSVSGWVADIATVTSDSENNIFLAGSFGGTADFDLGTSVYELTSLGDIDIFFAKYDGNGNFIYAKLIGGEGFQQGPYIKIDANDNIYLNCGVNTGIVDLDPGLNEVLISGECIAKYDSDGNFLYYLTALNDGQFIVGSENSVFVASHNTGVLFRKFDVNGNEIYQIPVDGIIQVISMDEDDFGNIFLTGGFKNFVDFNPDYPDGSLTSYASDDIFIAKYDPNCNFLWANRMGGASMDQGIYLKVDNTSNIWIAGFFGDYADFDPGNSTNYLFSQGGNDIFLAKYSNDGDLLIANSLGSAGYEGTAELLLDNNNSVYLLGYFSGSIDFDPSANIHELNETFGNFFICKYDSTGGYQFANAIDHTWPGHPYCSYRNSVGRILLAGSYYQDDDLEPGIGDLNFSNDADAFFIVYEELVTTPSFLKVQNEINNNPGLSTPKVLWSGSTTDNPSTIKVCADHSASTKVYFTNNSSIPSFDIRFVIKSDPNEIKANEVGKFSDYVVDGNAISATYTHPGYVGFAYHPSRQEMIDIIDKNFPSQPYYEVPLAIYRSLVMMVHGLRGDGETFKTMKEYIDQSGYYPPELTYKINYSATNQSMFAVNTPILKNEITALLSITRKKGYSCGKVDLIGHSMGGDLSRLYLQGSTVEYRGDINRLITLNTPHSGSQWANIMCDKMSPLSSIFGVDDFDQSAYGDLKTDSYATDVLLNGTSFLNSSKVPSHVLHSDLNAAEYSSCDTWLTFCLVQMSNILHIPVDELIQNKIFDGEANDLVVSESSQKGGLNSSTYFYNVCHLGSASDPSIINDVIVLLNSSPLGLNYDTTGFNPPDLMSPADSGAVNNIQLRETGDITIINPLPNSTYECGDYINVFIESTGSINKISFAAIGETEYFYFIDSSTTTLAISYQTPIDYIGLIKLVAIGYGDSGLVAFDTITIYNETSVLLDSIGYYPDKLYIAQYAYSAVNLKGFFQDGVVRSLNFDNDVQYYSADYSVASHLENNLIEGNSLDSTIITIVYKGDSIFIPVYVFQGEPTSSTQPHSHSSKNYNKLKIIPNPSAGNFTIQFCSQASTDARIDIVDLFGRRSCASNTKAVSKGINSISIDLSGLNEGIYIVTVIVSNEALFGKIEIIK